MELLGTANWWLPGWLARRLPAGLPSGSADRSEDWPAPEPADVR
jgi:hypothetical protein